MTIKPIKKHENSISHFILENRKKRGWNAEREAEGSRFLRKNEVAELFPVILPFLGSADLLAILRGNPVAIIKVNHDSDGIGVAIKDAFKCVNQINSSGIASVNIAIGVAGGGCAGFNVATYFLVPGLEWQPLKSHNAALTAIPTPSEMEQALQTNDGTTCVIIPDQSEFIDAAIEISKVLRQAKIEATLRSKVIGALIAAMHGGNIETDQGKSLSSVNELLRKTINKVKNVSLKNKTQLIDALELSGADFNRLSPFMGHIVTILNGLNVGAVLQTGTDFLGMFYEAFLRYGYDNNKLGVVFTPRHITRFCVQLSDIKSSNKVIDIASGTGGFLVAAFDEMNRLTENKDQREIIKESMFGFDTNPTIWALASLNMLFRGEGKSHIENGSCFDQANRVSVARKFNRAYLNPPFSQKDEPESLFIDASMDALLPGGILSAVVLAGVFADEEHRQWRSGFLKKHRLLGVISLPDDLFYPSAAPTSIIIVEAHTPHAANSIFMARICNDGYEKLKGRRVSCAGEQLTEVGECFSKSKAGESFASILAITIPSEKLADGQEWSPQQWLPQPIPSQAVSDYAQAEVVRSMFRSVVQFPELADKALPKFGVAWSEKPLLPINTEKPLSFFFDIGNGRSSGEKGFASGDIAYISSGDTLNSVVRLIEPVDADHVFEAGAITMTAFGQACIQPWPFVARGNGGSSVRILTPRFNMSVRELVWFVAQINMQRWRYFYLRQAIKSRLAGKHFKLSSPVTRLPDSVDCLAVKLQAFKQGLDEQSKL